jgi:O-methyltransferase
MWRVAVTRCAILPTVSRRLISLSRRRPTESSPTKTVSETETGPPDTLHDASEADRRIIDAALPYTMTGAERLLALVDAVRYCARRPIRGSLVECGVWRGGSALAMILTLQELGRADLDIYLYDTFEGMTLPTEHDVSETEGAALDEWRKAESDGRRPWDQMFGRDVFDEEGVRALLLATGYPAQRLHFVRGPVEQTIPDTMPDEVALLRLDTDWYESTRHELLHLFPCLTTGGVLIIDDYGHWQGARQAVDEYFGDQHPLLLLSRIDYSGRMAIKS